MDYQPLLVRAEMAGAIAIDPYFTLDGLLGAAIIRVPDLRAESRHRRHYERLCQWHGRESADRYYAGKGWPIPGRHFVPLATWGHGRLSGVWVYAASYAVPDEPCERDVQYWTRRVDVEGLLRWVADPPRRLETAKGPDKAYHMPLALLVTPALTFHVCGDVEAIRGLLAEVPYIGKKRAQGHGRVRRWVVEAEATDRSVWDGDRLARPVPADLLAAMGIGGEFEYGYYAYRPPYHDSRNFARCAMSGSHSQKPASLEQKVICETERWGAIAQEAFG